MTARIRSVALLLALVLASHPAMSVVCGMDCAEPPAASSLCHDTNVANDVPALHATHLCDHDHSGGSPALLTIVVGRDSVGASLAAAPVTLAESFVSEAQAASRAAMDGPPGLHARRSIALTTVLRI